MAEALNDFLASQFSYVRNWTLMACKDLRADRATEIPAGARTHILWELGHILWSQEHLVTWGNAGERRLTVDWEKRFGFRSRVSTKEGEYPALEEVEIELESGREFMDGYIRSLSPEELDSPPAKLSAATASSKLGVFKHLLCHEAYHVGKISLLRQMLGLRSVAQLYLKE